MSEGLPYQTVRRLNRQDDGTLFLSFTPVHDDSTKKPFSRKEHADGDIGKTPVPEYPRLSGKKTVASAAAPLRMKNPHQT